MTANPLKAAPVIHKILALVGVFAAAGAVILFDPASAAGRDFPVCSYGSGGGGENGAGGGIMRCEFENYQQCIATTSGTGGYCMDNPILGAVAQPDKSQQSPRRNRRH